MIVDSDVLIWFFRGNEKALQTLYELGPFSLSCITQMELMQGAKNKKEQTLITKQFEAWRADIIFINEQISERASGLVREFSLKGGITISDALIAATALEHNAELLTANTKHFEMVPRLKVARFNAE